VARIFVLACCVWLATAQRASADTEQRHVLRWTRAPGAETCIDAPALSAAVDARLGRSVFATTSEQAISIEGHVRPIENGWHVAFSVRAPDGSLLGQRELEQATSDCRALDNALVLVVALIVDPDAAMSEPPAPPPPVKPVPPPEPEPVTPPPPPPAPATPWRLGASLSLLGAELLLPGASIGGALGVRIDPPTLPAFVLRGTLWREDEKVDGARGGRFRLITAGVAMCPSVWRLLVCGGAELGRMAGEGFGFDRSQRSAAIVAYATVEPQLRVDLTSRLAVTAAIGLWIPLVRPRFVFDQAGTPVLVYQPSVAAGVGQAGLTVRF
jgi:hypothetical protein